MTTKFYLHAAVSTNTGTLPSAAGDIALAPANPIEAGTLINHSMNGTIGVAQTSYVQTFPGDPVGTFHNFLMGRFLSAPIAAQTIAVQSTTYQVGGAQANSNSNFAMIPWLALWRPTTGTVIAARILNGANATANPGTTETNLSATQNTGSGVVALDGDILVLDVTRTNNFQSMATAYTNTLYYDGTTEGSITSNAAYLLFTNDVAMYVAPTVSPVRRVGKFVVPQ